MEGTITKKYFILKTVVFEDFEPVSAEVSIHKFKGSAMEAFQNAVDEHFKNLFNAVRAQCSTILDTGEERFVNREIDKFFDEDEREYEYGEYGLPESFVCHFQNKLTYSLRMFVRRGEFAFYNKDEHHKVEIFIEEVGPTWFGE